MKNILKDHMLPFFCGYMFGLIIGSGLGIVMAVTLIEGCM